MKKLAVITARGGSKRIPRKNIKEFCGKPIIAYSIEAAIKSGVFDEVMVSTDDDEIADIARHYGASVPFMRSDDTSNDYATSSQVLLEVLKQYKEIGQKFDVVACIYPTAPFVTGDKLKAAVKVMEEEMPDTVASVVQYSFPPQRGFYEVDGRMQFAQPEHRSTRSQDLAAMYHDAGQFYVMRTDRFVETGQIFGEDIRPIIIDEMEVQDIDNETDWKLAEAKYRLLHELI